MPIRVAIPDMISPSYFPAIAAVELGFFKKEGLDATIELLFPVTKTCEALRTGRLDFVGQRPGQGTSGRCPFLVARDPRAGETLDLTASYG